MTWSLLISHSKSNAYVIDVNVFKLKAHKIVLAMKSDYFRMMFTNGMIQSKKKNEVDAVDVRQDVFAELLKYIYTGTVSIEKISI